MNQTTNLDKVSISWPFPAWPQKDSPLGPAPSSGSHLHGDDEVGWGWSQQTLGSPRGHTGPPRRPQWERPHLKVNFPCPTCPPHTPHPWQGPHTAVAGAPPERESVQGQEPRGHHL